MACIAVIFLKAISLLLIPPVGLEMCLIVYVAHYHTIEHFRQSIRYAARTFDNLDQTHWQHEPAKQYSMYLEI